MVGLLDADGNLVEVADPVDAATRLNSGELTVPAGTRLPVMGADGTVGTIDPSNRDDVARVLQGTLSGDAGALRLASGAERHQQHRIDTAPGAAETAFMAGANAAGLGLPELAMRVQGGAGNRAALESISAGREVNPGAALAGEGVGILTGPAGAIGRGIGAGVQGMRGIAARALGEGIQGATMGAISGSTEAAEDTDHALTAERWLAHTGRGAAEGAAVGAGFGLGIGALGAGLRATGRGLNASRRAVSGAFTRALGAEARPGVVDAYLGMVRSAGSRGLDSASREVVERGLSRTAAGREFRTLLDQGDAFYERAIPTMRSNLDRIGTATREVSEEFKGNLKRANIGRAILDSPAALGDIAAGARSQADDMRRLINAFDDNAASVPGARQMATNLRGLHIQLRRDIEALAESGSETAASDLFMRLDSAKRMVGKISERAQRSPNLTFVRDEIQGQYANMQRFLERGDLFGSAATAQAEINSVWSRLIANSREFGQRFESASGTQDAFRREFTADPRRISSYLRRTGTATGSLEDELVQRQVALSREFAETIGKHFEGEGVAEAVREARAAAQSVEGSLSTVRSSAADVNQFRALTQTTAGRSGLVPNPAAIGAFVGGAPGALVGAGVGGIIRPDRIIKLMGALERGDSAIAGALEKTGERIANAARIGGKAAATAGRAAARPLRVLTVRALLDVAQDAQSEEPPDPAQDRDMRAIAPEVSVAIDDRRQAARQFLRERIPPQAAQALEPSPLGTAPREPAISASERAKFSRYVQGVSDPMAVIEAAADGEISREGIEAMRAVYPRMYEQLVEHVTSGLNGADVDYQGIVRLSVLLGQPLDPTMQPGHIAAFQAFWGPEQPEQSGQLAQTASRANLDLASGFETGSQALVRRRA